MYSKTDVISRNKELYFSEENKKNHCELFCFDKQQQHSKRAL